MSESEDNNIEAIRQNLLKDIMSQKVKNVKPIELSDENFMQGQTDVLLFNCMVPNKEYTLEELARLSGKDKTTVFRSMQKLTSIGVVIKNSRTIPRGGYYHTYNLSDIDNIKKISMDRINSTHEGFIQLLDQLIEDISARINPVP